MLLSVWLSYATALLISCAGASFLNNNTSAAPTLSTTTTATAFESDVPLFLSNISLSTTTKSTSTARVTHDEVPVVYPIPAAISNFLPAATASASAPIVPQKVPSLRRNASVSSPENVAALSHVQLQQQQQLQQSPASVFLANYNNQQNVMQLVRNIDARLRNIRNVEMRVATIQEIFDSMHVSSSSGNAANNKDTDNTHNNNGDYHQQSTPNGGALEQDLQLFSRRLAKKLQKATHAVLELRDFFRFNITRYALQSTRLQMSDYNEEEEDDDDDDDAEVDAEEEQDDAEEQAAAEFDIEIDDLDGGEALSKQKINLYLSTYIEPCQIARSTIVYASANSGGGENYNKQQIQILNYLKTERNTMPQLNSADHLLNENENERSLAANTYIVERLQNLKATLTKTDQFEGPPSTSMKTPPTTTTTMQNAKLKFLGNHFKHIYFLSRSDHASDNSESFYYDLHFRHLFVAAIKRKFVFLLIDVGSAMNAELFELTKSYVTNILQLLSDTDVISVVTVSDEARSMQLEDAPTAGLYLATRERKDEILNYINNLNVAAKALTNHSLGFEYAFGRLRTLQNSSLLPQQHPTEFVYITRGLLTNLSDATHVLNVIAQGQSSLLQPIVINTCAVVLDEKRIMYEKQFLTDIATQNYTKYDIRVGDWYYQAANSFIGKFYVLTKMHPDTLMLASTAIFENAFESQYLDETLEVHAPVVDGNSNDVIVSITHAVAPFGVVGVNLYLADLIEDVINYRQQEPNANVNDFTYAFLINRSDGVTVAHPAFPRPSAAQSQTPFPVDIGFLENATNFAQIRRQMLEDESGNASSTVYLTNNRNAELMDRSYHWQSILGIYVLCLVATTKRESTSSSNANSTADNVNKLTLQHMPTSLPINLQRFVKDNNMPPPFTHADYEYLSSVDLLYHRLDLIPPSNTEACRYFRQMATFDAPTLFLSAAAFDSPFTYLHNNRMSTQQTQVRTVESIMAYIKDATGLLANPGLRPQIRHEVNALYNAMQHLKKRHQDARGSLKNYIIRRYIATVNGVLQVYPGCLLSNNYDATRRPWFRKAMQQPGKIVTTEPYLDAGGAGYIITIAHTIFEGKANALHSTDRDQAVAIVALDLPYAYYYKMILDTTPLCQQNNIKCLLFENEGFLIAHPSMLEASTALKNQRRPHEHLTHKESFLANDILNHKTLVRKLACANYQNRTLQRYYVFNTSLTDILTNVVHGERTKYAISLVRGSNIFAAVLNSTCDGGAFCPCSTIDRICLNCNRMDQMDCECPCECPMELADVFIGGGGGAESTESHVAAFSNYTKQYAYCEPPSEHFIALPSSVEPSLLHSCVNINCDVYGTQSECLAVMGCEWCQQDLDGNSFSAAFCTAQAACFNGVLSSLTPYGDLDDLDIISAHGYNPGQKPNSYSAFGPVGGAIVVLAIVIGFAIYCYRHNLDTHAQDQFYIDSMQEENYGLPLSRFNFDDCQAGHDEPPGSAYDHPAAQRNLIHPADISPYHVSTGSSYRRPPNGESDHGYSTMTPHEDSSDHQCFTLAEPLLLNDKRHSKSDTLSISTSISSPTNRHQQQQQPPPPSQHYHNPYLSQSMSAKDARCYNLSSPQKKFHSHSPARGGVYEQTTLPLHTNLEDLQHQQATTHSPHYILAPVTVHRHMETSES